ncbi:MAG: hypothetical protein A3A04_01925 [Candidatus Harrisonbacteria bacterium RIFCSPLOWO2_01_FULL_40_28]|uniref:NodB homology domain-containing protein n=1 Tax=Candidatus Harrisonbacteria bacterium RIFCSPLOWO2_01_FULL_40_28 TaxID=1798406 RepID=A0A1G1ZM08_9BACT|nr:MAG: hypothetical protein A3A04_01925 [Candidatus Harrisonbacteria bacterium RIFCSPLOWO2_01_FULL_40_28]
MNTSIKKIKAQFTILVVFLFLFVVGMSFIVRDNPYFTGTYITGLAQYFKYRISYARSINETWLASVSHALKPGSIYTFSSSEAEAIPVLVYHGLLDKHDGSKINILVDEFKEQMFALKRAGYETIGMDDLYQFMRGEKKLFDKSFMITFDDGRKDSYYEADPILNALGYKAIMFVISDYSLRGESSYYLSREELRRMEESGRWEIESHTKNGHSEYDISPYGEKGHFFSNKLYIPNEDRLETEEEFTARVEDDLRGVKDDLENEVGVRIIGFAFPFGDFGKDSFNFRDAQEIVRKATDALYPLSFYQTDFRSKFTFNYFEETNSKKENFFIRRIDAGNPEWSADRLMALLESAHPKSLPYHDAFSRDNGWITAWSNFKIKDNGLIIKTGNEETGAAAILDGSFLWRDYVLRARVSSPRENGIYVWARFKDEHNWAGCNFGKNFVHVERAIQGEKRVIKGIRDNIEYPVGDFEVAMKAYGRNVECILNGEVIVRSSFLEEELSNGGIGFKTWDERENNSEVIIKEVHVEEIKSENND